MMYRKKCVLFFLGALATLDLLGQSKASKFDEVYRLINIQNVFKAKEIYDSNKDAFPFDYQQFTEAILYNAFNQLQKSQESIELFSKGALHLPDSLLLKLYKVKKDNAIKLYNYKEAKKTIVFILNNYKYYLSSDDIADLENDLKIWSALETTPAQTVTIPQHTVLQMTKDFVGLKNLKITAYKDTLNFIFDTGANISTTTKSVAERLAMKLIPVDIEVGTITGTKVLAQLAVCDRLNLGDIEFSNVVFLVMADEELAFPQLDYQIYGILGFPVIEALKEIQITQKDEFIVPKNETTFTDSPNMALHELTPLMYTDNMHFTFDTGADKTIFYSSYYKENEDDINKRFELEKVNFGGAGGNVQLEGYLIEHTFKSLSKPVTLHGIQLLKDKIKDKLPVYGNIGQDLIQNFDMMTINFNQMHIKLE